MLYYYHLYEAQRHKQSDQLFYITTIFTIKDTFLRSIIMLESEWNALRLMLLCFILITYITYDVFNKTFV